MKEEGIYAKRLEGNGAKKQRKEVAEIDKSKTRHDNLKPDGAMQKRDWRMREGSAGETENVQKGEISVKQNKQNYKE